MKDTGLVYLARPDGLVDMVSDAIGIVIEDAPVGASDALHPSHYIVLISGMMLWMPPDELIKVEET